MKYTINIDAWLLLWWLMQTVHLASVYATTSLRPALVFWGYLTLLVLGRVAFLAAREALIRRRQSRECAAPSLASDAEGGEGPQGAVQS